MFTVPSMDGVDDQLLLFRKQYLQLLEPDFLTWPPRALLQDAGVQQWIYRSLFEPQHNKYLPADRYRFRVLKILISKIEQAIDDPNEHEVCDDLISHFSSLVSSEIPSEIAAVQQRSFVTYTCSNRDHDSDQTEPSVTILERRNLISGSQTTGFRTWEAGLHLANFLTSAKGRVLVTGKHIIELGSGTGLLTILCVKYLGATRVTATDGDETVIDALNENATLNGIEGDRRLESHVLRWGHDISGMLPDDGSKEQTFDLMLGADIIYDKTAVSPLVATMLMLFAANPKMKVLMATAIRNQETFSTFQRACAHHAFNLEEIEFPARPMRQQIGPFYATAMPLRIYLISSPLAVQTQS